MNDAQPPIDILRWGLAPLPIVALLILLVLLRWKALQAGPVATFAAAVALFASATPWEAVAVAIIGRAWAKTFGTLGVMWEALTRATDVLDPNLGYCE